MNDNIELNKNIIIDFNHINNMASGDPQIIKDIIDIFLRKTPETIELLNKYCINKEWDKLKQSAHSLKTMFSYVGMSQFYGVCEEIEEKEFTDKNIHLIESMVNLIYSQYKEACQLLSTHSENLSV